MADRPPLTFGIKTAPQHDARYGNFSGSRDDAPSQLRRLNALPDEHCETIGRDPASIGRSAQLFAEPDDLDRTRRQVTELVEAGADQVVLNLLPPFDGLLPRLVEAVIKPVRATFGTIDADVGS
jgi:hypothetical protein